MGLGRAWDGSQTPMEEEGGEVGREVEADWGEVPHPGMDPGRRSPTVVWDIGGPVAEPLEEEGGRGEGDAVAGGYWGTADTGVHPIGGLWWQGAATAGDRPRASPRGRTSQARIYGRRLLARPAPFYCASLIGAG